MADSATRHEDLRQLLEERRTRMEHEVRGRIRDGRRDRLNEVRDDLERSDADIQEETDLVVLQMRTATLARINEALVRLKAGAYGSCPECSRRIPLQRLRAMPFAIRCRPCEAGRETEQGKARQAEMRRAEPFAMVSG